MAEGELIELLERLLARRPSLRDLLPDVEGGQLTPQQCEELRAVVVAEMALEGLDKLDEPTSYGKMLDALIGWLGTRTTEAEQRQEE